VRFYYAVESLGRYVVDLFNGIHVHIDNGTAFIAVKMIMKTCVGIEVIETIADSYLLKFSDIGKKLKITIYRSERDIGKLIADIHINRIRSGMILAGHHKLFYRLSLA